MTDTNMERALTAVLRLSDAFSVEYLTTHGVLPLSVTSENVLIGTWHEEINPQVLDDLTIEFGVTPTLKVLPEDDLRSTIRRIYEGPAMTAESFVADLGGTAIRASDSQLPLDDLRSRANEAPVVMLVNLLLLEALDARASDVHLESTSCGLRVRYRIDGVIHDAATPPDDMRYAVLSRLKIMAELDIAERRLPQDGRIRLQLRDRQVDVRVSTLPTLHGESVVLRLLDQSCDRRVGLDGVGMNADMLAAFVSAVSSPNGLVLVTGPTGSGKTTTLYAALQRLSKGSEKIVTVEDPVEYELAGVCQVPVQPRVGLTFATTLRAILRQDPDVVLVGEIRDAETAEVATHAALTGHLVLATLHTNDAPSAVARLIDLEVNDYLVASTLRAVLAQRLVRCVCIDCARTEVLSAGDATELGIDRGNVTNVQRGVGCERCRGSGYRGRTGIYELLTVDRDVRRLAHARRLDQLTTHLSRAGWRTMRHDGIEKIRAGITTPEEVLRATRTAGDECQEYSR